VADGLSAEKVIRPIASLKVTVPRPKAPMLESLPLKVVSLKSIVLWLPGLWFG